MLFSIVVPVTSADVVVAGILSSLAEQTVDDWELVFAVGAGVEFRTREAGDSRVRTMVVEATDFAGIVNEGLSSVAGMFAMIAPHDGEFTANAIELLAEFVAGHDGADVVYSDEGIARHGRRPPRLVPKPSFSPERLRNQFYLGDAAFYRTQLLRDVGGVRPYDGAELYDLALRATPRARSVRHLNESLFVRGQDATIPGEISGTIALESTRAALQNYLDTTGGGVVAHVSESGIHDTRRLVEGEPLVSIVIPTRGGYGDVRGTRTCLILEAVESIRERSTYRNYEVVVVMDDVVEAGVVDRLRDILGDRLKLIWWNRPFSFSAKVNFGAFHSKGEYLLFLNDDTEVVSPGWIEAMLALCQRPKAGMVGAMLYFEDDTIQHAGHIYEGGDAGHIGTNLPRGSDGPFGSFRVEREIAGVTAACSMVSTRVFEEAGGFSLLLPGNFNDVDLCLKIKELGYQSYWTPHAELYHYESKSRHSRVSRYEVETAWGRWEWKLHDRDFWPYGIWGDSHIG